MANMPAPFAGQVVCRVRAGGGKPWQAKTAARACGGFQPTGDGSRAQPGADAEFAPTAGSGKSAKNHDFHTAVQSQVGMRHKVV